MELTNEQIKEICLNHGFKEKDQGDGRMDLNPYVYDAVRAAIRQATGTPGAVRPQLSEQDEFRDYIKQERSSLAMGFLTDDQLANAVYLADRNSLKLIGLQTAAKERIRWLSRKVEEHAQTLPADVK